jgi:hypothetical protein
VITFLLICVYIYTYKFSHSHPLFSQELFFYFFRNWLWMLVLNDILQRITSGLVQMEEYIAHDNFSFPIGINFHQFPLFTLVREGTEILSWSIIQRQFISSFCFTASRTGKASLPSFVDKFLPLCHCMAQIQVTPAFILSIFVPCYST